MIPEAARLVPEAPLPATRFLPGVHPHPRRDPRGSLYGAPEHAAGLPAERWAEDVSYLLGIDLYHQGYLWESHEAWEACFFVAEERHHRDVLQSLIQLTAAELQLHRGVGAGVRTLAARLSMRLGRVVEALGACPSYPSGPETGYADRLPDGDARVAGLAVGELHRACMRRFRGALDPGGDPLDTGGPPVRLSPRKGPAA